MTRYQYARFDRHEPAYRVQFRQVTIGECWKASPAYSQAKHPSWLARIHTDPFVVGKGRTRDDAVDDAYEQVGGPDA